LEVERSLTGNEGEGSPETKQDMETDRKWVVVRIDGKIAAISTDYRKLAEITARIAREGQGKKAAKDRSILQYEEITAGTVSFGHIWNLREEVGWEDLMLFGTDFQKRVWRKLWELTHCPAPQEKAVPSLICYSDFAGLCENKAGVRAVAHAIGLNPVSVLIPCHLVIPKESIDKINEINRKAESTIFKGDDLCINSILNDNSIDFGEYALGRKLKRELIIKEFEQPCL